MTLVIPAIIPHSYNDVVRDVERVKTHVNRVQIDVMGGLYTPKASWPYTNLDDPAWQELKTQQTGLPAWEQLEYEVDMMTMHPEEKMNDWINAGVSTLIIHKHSTDDVTIDSIITEANERGVGVAIALKPSTNNDELEPFIERLAFVQCMGNDRIGFHGVPFDDVVLDKIRDLKSRWEIEVGVDIGVNFATAPRIIEAGATRLVSGSAIFETDNVEKAIRGLSCTT